jgi:lipoprotein-releasing system permease protein
MYKLTLCLKYLFRRGLAYFATIGVSLCVLMMLVVVSVLNGFVDKIERAAKGLFGDIVVSTPSLSGMAYYDDFIARLRKQVPEVEGASPFILTYGILQIPGDPDFRRPVQVTGIRLPERASVSDFEEGLFVQKNWPNPTFDPPTPAILDRLRAELGKLQAIGRRIDEEGGRAPPGADVATLRQRLSIAEGWQQTAIDNFGLAGDNRLRIEALRKELDKAVEEGNEPRRKVLEEELARRQRQAIQGPEDRVILGLGIPGLSFRTPKGETVRILGPGHNIGLSLIPFGRDLKATGMAPVTRQFTVIDDCATDVSSIDSEVVYVPFEAIQRLNNMDEQIASGDAKGVVEAARCSQIHVKVAPEWGRGEKLKEINARVERVFREFEGQYAARGLVVARSHVYVDTWRDRQIRLVQQIESQRTLMVIILGIISVVAIILIFVIFYVIVVQKTRDIGVLKAVGASGQGVAAIFLSYGAAIGLVGSVIGVIGAVSFVWNINPIHDWVARTFGFEVWSRETFMFEKIPNEVRLSSVVKVVLGAMLAGLTGAIFPALAAARRQPVEALRYE